MPVLTTKLEKVQGTFVGETLSQKDYSTIKSKHLLRERVEGDKVLYNYNKKVETTQVSS